MMTTTIQISDHTRQLLEVTKKRYGTKSFDETLLKLLEERSKPPKSMFGSLKGKIKPFTRKDRLEMWERE